MSSKQVLFLGNQSQNVYENFFQKFIEAIGKEESGPTEVVTVRTDLDLLSTIGQPILPHIVFIDADPRCERYSLDEFYNIAANLKNLDQQLFTVLLSHGDLNPTSTMRGFNHGIDAYIPWDTDLHASKDMILEALETKLEQPRRQLRAPARHKIKISIASIAQAVVSETLNVGVGGMFVRALPKDIQKGDHIDFEFLLGGPLSIFSDSPDKEPDNPLDALERSFDTSLSGSGWVVWIRPLPKENLPEGMGIKFVSLEENTQQLIENYIRDHKIQTFIPNS